MAVRARFRLHCIALALILAPLLVCGADSPRSAAAGDDTSAGAAPGAIPPRLAALEQEIRCLERHLGTLRRARVDLAAGRAEATPADETARRAAEVEQRALREVQRYESARAKATAQLSEALAAKDDARAALARGTLDGLDASFAEAMRKVEDARAECTRDAAKSRPPAKGAGASGASMGD